MPWRAIEIKRKNIVFFKYLITSIIIILFLLTLLHFYLRHTFMRIKRENQLITQKIEQLSPDITKINTLFFKKLNWQENIILIKTLQAQQIDTIHRWQSIEMSMIDAAYLDKVTEDKNKITITGYAKNGEAMTSLVNALRNTKQFSNIALKEIAVNQQTIFTHRFLITCEMAHDKGISYAHKSYDI